MGNKDEYEIIDSDGIPSGNIITRSLLLDSKQYNLFNRDKIEITCPVRMIHGLKDTLIPYEIALKFFKKLNTKDAEFILTKEMDHRLSLDGNLELLEDVVQSLLMKWK